MNSKMKIYFSLLVLVEVFLAEVSAPPFSSDPLAETMVRKLPFDYFIRETFAAHKTLVIMRHSFYAWQILDPVSFAEKEGYEEIPEIRSNKSEMEFKLIK